VSRDLTFAELIAANRAYRTALAELLGLVRTTLAGLGPRPAQNEILERAEAALERYQ
jgi:hypothetical protein